MKLNDGIERSAVFSPCGKYRYELKRRWDDGPLAVCVGLNPSTANHETDDRTISKLIDVMRYNKYAGFIMMNLYAVISSTTDILYSTPDPLKHNDDHLRGVFKFYNDVFYCWGAYPKLEARIRVVRALSAQFSNTERCFGKTKHGAPIHPAYYVRRGTPADQIPLMPL